MRRVGDAEAREQLPRLLDEVERGEEITITRQGVPIARLLPVDGERRNLEEVVENIKRLRQNNTLGDVTIRELIEEGRRY